MIDVEKVVPVNNEIFLLRWSDGQHLNAESTSRVAASDKGGASMTIVKTVRKPRFRSAEEMRKNAGRYREDRRDVASTYVLRPRLGIKCPGFRMVQKKGLR